MIKHIGNIDNLVQQGVLTPVNTNSKIGCFCSDARELGFGVGEWYETIKVNAYGRDITLKAAHVEQNEGDLQYVVYDSFGDGMINIKIFND